MLKTFVYLTPAEKDAWRIRLTLHGYSPYPRLGPALSWYIQDLLNQQLTTTPSTPLLHSPTSYISINRVNINVPDATLTLPSQPPYNLKNWTDFMYNVFNDRITSTLTPRDPLPYSPVIKPAPYYWVAITILTQPIIESLLPIQSPSLYTDNRHHHLPELVSFSAYADTEATNPHSTNTPTTNTPLSTAWYVPGVPRTQIQLSIPRDQLEPLTNLAIHFNMIPPRRRTQNSRITLVLESLYFNLLAKRTTPQTPFTPPED